MRIRVSLLLVSLLFPVILFAQSAPNEWAIFFNRASFHSTSESDPDLGITAKFKIDPKTGYGISFDHFIAPNMSVQLLAQSVRGNSKISVTDDTTGTTFTVPTGSIDMRQYDVALHYYFGSSPAVRPYAGLGVLRTQGGKVTIPADLSDTGVEETISLDDKFSWVADAGVDFRITRNGSIALSAKYAPYKTSVSDDPSDSKVKLDPLTIAAGLRWRF
jgi:outer membrane protein W